MQMDLDLEMIIMKNRFLLFFLFLIFIIFSSCKEKSLNARINRIEINDDKPLSQILNKDFKKIMIVSNKQRNEIIKSNCKKIKYSQKYESYDFIFLCIDKNDLGYIYVIYPFFGWLDSINIHTDIPKNIFFQYENIIIKRLSENEYVIYNNFP